MEDSIIFQAKLSRSDFDGYISLLSLLGDTNLKAEDKGEIEELWDAMKSAPIDLADVGEIEDISPEKIKVVLFALATNVGAQRLESNKK